MASSRRSPLERAGGRSPSRSVSWNSLTAATAAGVSGRFFGQTRSVSHEVRVTSSAPAMMFSSTVRSSKSSRDWNERRRPLLRPTGRAPAGDVLAVDADLALRGLDEPGDRVDQRGLAGAVRPDEPDDLPGLDLEAHVVDGHGAPEPHREILDAKGRGLDPARARHRGARAPAGRGARASSGPSPRPRTAGRAAPLGCATTETSSRTPPNKVVHEPSVEPALERLVADAADRHDGADDAAHHVADAADHRIGDGVDRLEGVEGAVLHHGRAEAEQRAAQGGDGAGEREGVHLRAEDAHPEGGGGALVGPHGQEAPARRRAAQVGEGERGQRRSRSGTRSPIGTDGPRELTSCPNILHRPDRACRRPGRPR